MCSTVICYVVLLQRGVDTRMCLANLEKMTPSEKLGLLMKQVINPNHFDCQKIEEPSFVLYRLNLTVLPTTFRNMLLRSYNNKKPTTPAHLNNY